jgi:hypothetical protein
VGTGDLELVSVIRASADNGTNDSTAEPATTLSVLRRLVLHILRVCPPGCMEDADEAVGSLGIILTGVATNWILHA